MVTFHFLFFFCFLALPQFLYRLMSQQQNSFAISLSAVPTVSCLCHPDTIHVLTPFLPWPVTDCPHAVPLQAVAVILQFPTHMNSTSLQTLMFSEDFLFPLFPSKTYKTTSKFIQILHKFLAFFFSFFFQTRISFKGTQAKIISSQAPEIFLRIRGRRRWSCIFSNSSQELSCKT